jgi:hypothetical protein
MVGALPLPGLGQKMPRRGAGDVGLASTGPGKYGLFHPDITPSSRLVASKIPATSRSEDVQNAVTGALLGRNWREPPKAEPTMTRPTVLGSGPETSSPPSTESR